MLQFMAILSVSTILSVVAYKIQHEGMQERYDIYMTPELSVVDISKVNSIE